MIRPIFLVLSWGQANEQMQIDLKRRACLEYKVYQKGVYSMSF